MAAPLRSLSPLCSENTSVLNSYSISQRSRGSSVPTHPSCAHWCAAGVCLQSSNAYGDAWVWFKCLVSWNESTMGGRWGCVWLLEVTKKIQMCPSIMLRLPCSGGWGARWSLPPARHWAWPFSLPPLLHSGLSSRCQEVAQCLFDSAFVIFLFTFSFILRSRRSCLFKSKSFR